MIITYLLVFVLGVLVGQTVSSYLWGKVNEALAELIIARAGACGDAHDPYTKCQLPLGHSGSHQHIGKTHRQEWG